MARASSGVGLHRHVGRYDTGGMLIDNVQRWRQPAPVTTTPSPLRIRRAHDGDWRQLWNIKYAVLAARDSSMLDPSTREHEARDCWMGPEVATYLAESEGAIVGTYVLRANQRELGAHVANAGFMVRPRYSGRGIGSLLGSHVIGSVPWGFRHLTRGYVDLHIMYRVL